MPTILSRSRRQAEATLVDTSGEPTDQDLLRSHLNGRPDAFGGLVRRHRDRLWAVALRTTGNPEDAADALQDAYLAAFRRAGSYRGEAQLTTWLHRVVVNACLDRLRHNRSRAAEPLPEDFDRRAAAARRLEWDPLELGQRSTVSAALRRLTTEQRAALVLVDMEGYSVAEAATLLGCARAPSRAVASGAERGWSRCWPSCTVPPAAIAEQPSRRCGNGRQAPVKTGRVVNPGCAATSARTA